MYKRRYKSYNNKNRADKGGFRKEDPMIAQTKDRATNERAEAPKDVHDGISQIAMSQLPKSSYATKADPYTELNQASEPYNWLTKFNKKFSPSYKGDPNLESGFVSQFITAEDTGLLFNQDCSRLNIGINYRFLPITRALYTLTDVYTTPTEMKFEPQVQNIPTGIVNRHGYRGSQLLRKMYDAVNEIFSQLDATTFMELRLTSKYVAYSSLLIPDVAHTTHNVKQTHVINGSNTTVYVKAYRYTDPAAVFLLMAIEYQTIIQQSLMNVKMINKMYNNEALSLKMQYDREIAPLNQFYGQINKTSFKALLKSVQLAVQGEYTDLNWARNNNVVTQLNSRVADDMVDAVKELCAVYNFAPVMIFTNGKGTEGISDQTTLQWSHIQNTCIWCGGELTSTSGGVTTDHNNRQATLTDGDGTYVADYRKVGSDLATETSLTYILAWARKNGGGMTSVAFYNSIVRKVLCTDQIMTSLKTKFGDLRTILDKLTPLGVVNYFKGVFPAITNELNVRPVDYVLVDDMFKMALSGPTKMTFSPQTSRWTNYALWDKFEGIPGYDYYNGGSFITFCLKTIDCSNMETCELEYLPLLFTMSARDDHAKYEIKAVDRNGDITTYVPQTTTLNATRGTARLAILNDFNNYGFMSPKMSAYTGTASDAHKSYSEFFCMNNFKTYYDSSSSKYEIESSIVGIYPYEIQPVQSSMLSYAKSFGPLKGTTNAQAEIGFAGIAGATEDSLN